VTTDDHHPIDDRLETAYCPKPHLHPVDDVEKLV
jgi:hypothetical protein